MPPQVVKFVGKSELGSGTWVGVAMVKPVGNHDGQVKGKRYFTCKKGHGLMVRQDQVQVRALLGLRRAAAAGAPLAA